MAHSRFFLILFNFLNYKDKMKISRRAEEKEETMKSKGIDITHAPLLSHKWIPEMHDLLLIFANIDEVIKHLQQIDAMLS